jgi:hypothetical protein
MPRSIFILAAAVLQPLLSAIALPLLGSSPLAMWLIYIVVLGITVAVLARPMLACLRSVTASAEAQTAEDLLRKAKAESKLKGISKTKGASKASLHPLYAHPLHR